MNLLITIYGSIRNNFQFHLNHKKNVLKLELKDTRNVKRITLVCSQVTLSVFKMNYSNETYVIVDMLRDFFHFLSCSKTLSLENDFGNN